MATPRFRKTAVLALGLALHCASNAYDAANMVSTSRGTMPLILTAPHDGGEFLDRLPVRTRATIVRDAGTRELTERVAALIEQRIGQRPYVVIARFSRQYLDANRAEAQAMESPDALPAYRAYHDHIQSYVAEVKATFPQGGLLLDVHGQSQEPNTTLRGTRAGLTAQALLRRAGPDALQGPDSIIGLLAAKGYPVHPAIGSASLSEDRRYAGGYTVVTYGSHRADGIDAIQLEFGRDHRANPRLPEDVADALIGFMRAHGLLAR